MKKRLTLKNLEVKSFTTAQQLRGGIFEQGAGTHEPCEDNSSDMLGNCSCTMCGNPNK